MNPNGIRGATIWMRGAPRCSSWLRHPMCASCEGLERTKTHGRKKSTPMTYEIRVPTGVTPPPDLDLAYDNPNSAKEDLQELQSLFPQAEFEIFRDGTPLTPSQLAADLTSYEIGQVIRASCELPSTFRRGWSNTTDEVATGPDGNPTKVWDPENPEDRFDLPYRQKPRD
jgi:hypothetical protein